MVYIWQYRLLISTKTESEDIIMEIFTDTEKCILEGTDKSYKWIARDRDGCLYFYKT